MKEAEAEAQLFSQSAAIDELLIMMRNLEGKNEDIADNDELQELYHQSMSARPGIKKLIDKYNQKQSKSSYPFLFPFFLSLRRLTCFLN